MNFNILFMYTKNPLFIGSKSAPLHIADNIKCSYNLFINFSSLAVFYGECYVYM